MPKDRVNWDRVRWTPFQEAGAGLDMPAHIKEAYEDGSVQFFLNSIYQVEMRGIRAPPPFGRVIWLSIKTLDKQPRHDWRELQRIKNEIVGEEVEAVELYPAEGRLTDTSNQFHLWCFPELAMPGNRFPFGYWDRILSQGSEPGIADSGKGARQRDFPPDARPADVLRIQDLKRLEQTPTARVGGRCIHDFSPLIYDHEDVVVTVDGIISQYRKLKCIKHGHEYLLKKEAASEDQDEGDRAAEPRG